MGGGGYDLDAVARGWSIEYLVMLDAPIPEELHDAHPPEWTGDKRRDIDRATDAAVRDALAAAFR